MDETFIAITVPVVLTLAVEVVQIQILAFIAVNSGDLLGGGVSY